MGGSALAWACGLLAANGAKGYAKSIEMETIDLPDGVPQATGIGR